MASSVVGILIKGMPRLKVEAANPPRSVTMPPPRLIISEWRVAPYSCSLSHTQVTDFRFLWMSPTSMVNLVMPFKQLKVRIFSQQ